METVQEKEGEEMNIYEALKSKDKDLRLTCGPYKWLMWDGSSELWEVYSRERYQRESIRLYCGDSCGEAIAVLCYGQSE